MDELDKNIVAYEKAQTELEREHMGKWVLFHDEELIGVFASFEEASQKALKDFGVGPYLIRQIGTSSITLPVSVMVTK